MAQTIFDLLRIMQPDHFKEGKTQLIETVTKTTFLPQKADLYEFLVKQGGAGHGELLNWCRNGLQPLTKAEWLHDSAKDLALFRLAIELHKQSVTLSLGEEYVDAVSTFFSMIAKGPRVSFHEDYRLLPELVSENHRAKLRDLFHQYFKDNRPEKPPSRGH